MKFIAGVLSIAMLGATAGCALGVAADEIDEAKDCDDDFDPLEEVTGSEDGCN